MATQHDKKSDDKAQAERALAQETLSTPAKHAQRAMDSAEELVAGADLDELDAKVSGAASALYRGGLDLVANREELSQAKDQLSDAIRKNPLGAIGVALVGACRES